MYIAFEGIDGCGKTTQIELLKEALPEHVVFTRQPGGTEVGLQLRQMVLHDTVSKCNEALAFIFAADAAEQVASVIRPSLMAGRPVISDRGYHSNVVYQSAGRRHTHAKTIYDIAWQGFVPDKVIFIDVPIDVMRQRQGDLDEVERSFDDKAYKHMRYMYKSLVGPDFYEVDGRGSVPEIHAQILGLLETFDTARSRANKGTLT